MLLLGLTFALPMTFPEGTQLMILLRENEMSLRQNSSLEYLLSRI